MSTIAAASSTQPLRVGAGVLTVTRRKNAKATKRRRGGAGGGGGGGVAQGDGRGTGGVQGWFEHDAAGAVRVGASLDDQSVETTDDTNET